MGMDLAAQPFNTLDRGRYRRKVQRCLDTLARMLTDGSFSFPRKNIGILLLPFLLTALTYAATGKEVSYKSGDEAVKGTLYAPANASGKLPALVVIHEWWGLNDWVKEQSEKLAGQGYVALAIDLYRGKVADN